MKLLLDTHVWIWSLSDVSRLPGRVKKALEDRGNELWVSPISTWELVMLSETGRIVLDRDLREWIASAMGFAPLLEAPLTHEVAIAAREITLPHRDPADRLIAATARVFGLTLVTADEQLIAGSGFNVFPFRR